MNLLFVKHIGYLGAPIAVAINYWIMFSGLIILTVFYVKPEDTPLGLHQWNVGVASVLKMLSMIGKIDCFSYSGLIMLEAEFLAFEILTLMASYLGTIALAAQSVGTTMAALTIKYHLLLGLLHQPELPTFGCRIG